MPEHVIQFATDGTGHCLWTEAVPLHDLGLLEIRRAGTIEFNTKSQTWEVRLASSPGTVAFSHPSRQTCLDWERSTLNDLQ
jgi:hypothetical protein